MSEAFFNLLVGVPQTVANFGDWLVTPLSEQWLPISPLGLLGVGGTALIIFIIGTHLVRLFV